MGIEESRFFNRDRKVLRKIDKDAANQSLMGVVGSLLVFALIVLAGNLYADHHEFTVAVAFGLLVSVFFRLLLIIRFEAIYPGGPARWRRLFAFALLTHALLWSAFLVMLVFFQGTSTLVVIAMLYTIGIATAFANRWLSDIKVGRLYMVISFVPGSLALLAQRTVDGYMLGILFFLYFYHMTRIATEQYHTFWRSVVRTNELRTKLNDLKIEETQKPVDSQVSSALIASITREMRTPMNSLMGMLSILKETDLESEQREYLKVATQSGELMLSLLDDVSDYSKILDGSLSIKTSVFNLRHSVEDCIEALAPLAQEKGVDLSCIVDPDLPIRVRGDSTRINQVLTALISNALVHGGNSDVTVEVHLTPQSNQEGLLRILVSDQGPGLSADKQEELFGSGPVKELLTGNRDVSGLGLVISRGLVQAMKGDMGVISEPGHGATFWFTVPLVITGRQSQFLQLQKKLQGKKAVIVGAPAGTTESLRLELDALSMDVESVDEADRALQALRTSAREDCAYDLVLIDFHGPESLNLSRTIAEDPSLLDIHQILLVNLMEREKKELVLHANQFMQVQFLSKPVLRRNLYPTLEKVFLQENSSANNPEEHHSFQKRELGSAEHYGRVLLVEDNKVNQMVTKGMLKRLGYGVKTVGNGKEAVNLLQDQPFDLVLMDCHMPEMDGYEATEMIRELEKESGRHVPIIAMTANTQEGEATRCLACGMDDYLAKPVHIDELYSRLRRWLGEHKDQEGVINISDQSDNETPDKGEAS